MLQPVNNDSPLCEPSDNSNKPFSIINKSSTGEGEASLDEASGGVIGAGLSSALLISDLLISDSADLRLGLLISDSADLRLALLISDHCLALSFDAFEPKLVLVVLTVLMLLMVLMVQFHQPRKASPHPPSSALEDS